MKKARSTRQTVAARLKAVRRVVHRLSHFQYVLDLYNATPEKDDLTAIVLAPVNGMTASLTFGGVRYNAETAGKLAGKVHAWTVRAIDRFLAGAPDPLTDPDTGHVDLVMRFTRGDGSPFERRPSGPLLTGKPPAGFVDWRGETHAAMNDLQDVWYADVARLIDDHRRLTGPIEKYGPPPDLPRLPRGSPRLTFRPIVKGRCGHVYFRRTKRQTTCGRDCTNRTYHAERAAEQKRTRRPRPRPTIPPPRSRRKTKTAPRAPRTS